MKYPIILRGSFIILLLTALIACRQETKWEGQAPVKTVPTATLPIQQQFVGTFELGDGILASNDFTGARLNGIVRTDDTLITALITPENTPINSSPWYAFKIWSSTPKNINLKLTYLDGYFHRYYPKLSTDGKSWKAIDEKNYTEGEKGLGGDDQTLPKDVTLNLAIGPDTLWVAAQELITSAHVNTWVKKLDSLDYISSEVLGQSREGRPITAMKIGNASDHKMIFILSRQHPPEVTGYLAMKSFVETIASDLPIAQQFREVYSTYVVPLANPDGVDNGHWRHNTGGVDLNRDWGNVNQKEVQQIQKFMEDKVAKDQGKFYFGVDFHSTWEDIFYTMSPENESNMPGLVQEMISAMGTELGFEPNVNSKLFGEQKRTSSEYFFYTFGAETLTYEIGDNTPRDLVKKKGEVSALKLMEFMLTNNKGSE
jgi:hypothetical protein